MPAKTNELKAALARGEVLSGCWLALGEAYAAELMAGAGFDWLVIDGEHAPNDLRSILAQLQVVDASPSHPVVRLPVGDTALIKQMLDIGAQSLLVPMVESSEQARALVRATRYPPNGVRGVGAALGRAARFGEISDYGITADQEICLILQVESCAGIEALDDILAVDGVDGVFIGPADLAADMGYMADPTNPAVRVVIDDAVTRIAAAGKAAGILAFDLDVAQAHVKNGVQLIAIGADTIMLADAARELAARGKLLG